MNINILGTKVHVVLVFLGALGVLLLFGCIGLISWGGWKMNRHDEAVADLGSQIKHLKNDNEKSQNKTDKLSSQVENLNKKLQEETKNLSSQVEKLNDKLQEETEKLKKVENLNEKSQNETEKLSSQVEKLNDKLQESQNETEKLSSQVENLNEKSQNETEKLRQIILFILKFTSYSVDENCISKECLLCKKGWIFFSGSCYFFSDMDLTWNESRQFCQNKSADLVVIDNLQEQKFIHDNIKTNSWLGLRKVGSDWVWVDGRNDTLGFWSWYYKYNPYGYYLYPHPTDSYAYMYRSGNPTASWKSVPDYNWYTYSPLCEQEAFKVSLN